MRASYLPLVLLPLLFLPACFMGRSTRNEPLDTEVIATFEPGRTTAEDVTNALGPPLRVVELDVRSAYLYEFTQTKNAGLVFILVNFVNTDERSDRIWLFFDSRDVLTHHGSTFAAERTEFSMPWSKIKDPKVVEAEAAEAAESADEESAAK